MRKNPNDEFTYVETTLTAVASEDLETEIKKELEISDPEHATATLKKLINETE